ncbi:TIGR04282 family arsenosugar biosynthesis glycosyltransferase [Zhongshania sp. BJYM1]|jgi:uncharacterized protein|uniref:TIGR04282 family arsenosugar biosynthesis glycosyltransferase n=1 Tax=Zhongshania aquatica TaxID=2965069 RepID=UPI0022B3281D|nr:TIGR04282 family arsenosugar biosynthesis glycosyltransferase [Marortus sp. BJYM1]
MNSSTSEFSPPSTSILRIGIQIIAKAPAAGLAKTRLIPALGAHGAAALAKKMLLKILSDCALLCTSIRRDFEFTTTLWMTPSPESPLWHSVAIPDGIAKCAQLGEDLGARMANAAATQLQCQDAVIIVGSDCPEINSSVLVWAAEILKKHDACLAPSADGGYALIGLRRHDARVFDEIPWSTHIVAELTRQRFAECGFSYAEYSTVHDIDEVEDLAYLPADWQESVLASF